MRYKSLTKKLQILLIKKRNKGYDKRTSHIRDVVNRIKLLNLF
jgi:hypothetical protein